MTHICVGKLTSIGSDNGLSPGRRQAVIWTSDLILLIGPSETNFNEILIGIYIFSFKKMHLKCLENGGHFVSALIKLYNLVMHNKCNPFHVINRLCHSFGTHLTHGRHFADDIFTYIFSNENCCILIKFSLKYVRKGPIDNNPAWTAPSHYLNQWWLVYRRIYASLGLNELTKSFSS